MSKRLYFIAIELPEPLKREITDWKKALSEKYKSVHALKTSPHITLQMPMRIEAEREEKLIEALLALDGQLEKGKITMDGISSFPPRTIFIDVKRDSFLSLVFERIQQTLHKAEFIENIAPLSQFHPHLSLMNRDLSEPMFALAWKDLKAIEFHETCEVACIQLYKHDGKYWQVLKEIRLKN